jgi:peroxiredoxin family protein
MSSDRLSFVVASGEADRLLPVAVLATGAAAMQTEVQIFLTMWGVLALRKGAGRAPLSASYKDMTDTFWKQLEEHHVGSFVEMLEQAKEIGPVQVLACGMSMDLFGLSLEDLESVVDGVAGVAGFLDSAQDGKILFV